MASHLAVLVITCCLMATLGVQIYYSDSMNKRMRQAFIKGAVLISACSTLDWLRVFTDGSEIVPIWLHSAVVSLLYSCAPLIVLLMLGVLGRIRENIFLLPLFLLNIGLQTTTQFTEWIFYIDSANIFVRGEYFRVYVAIYCIGIITMYRAVYKCSQEYQNRNAPMLLSSIISLTIGVVMSEINQDNHTTFLAVAIAEVMFYIYFIEVGLRTDSLTRLLNHRCYMNHLRKLDYESAIVVFDVNKFKKINDTYGHKNGDVVLREIATALRKIYGQNGYIFRIGGDEFAMVVKKGWLEKTDFDALEKSFCLYIDRIRSRDNPVMPSVSMGYALFYPGMAVDNVAIQADQNMYSHKNEVKAADSI